jgi:hypothetical protein
MLEDRFQDIGKNMKKLKELSQAVVDLCLEEYDMPSFPVVVKRVQRGRCNKKSITIPARIATSHHEAYQIYYAVHEAVHKIRGGGHGTVFKKTEDELLAKFGIKIKRKKAYPGDIWYDGENIFFKNK